MNTRFRPGTWMALPALLFLLQAAPSEAKIINFISVITGGQETPPTGSTGSGVGHVSLDTKAGLVCFSITFSGLGSVEVAAHIHGPAATGTAVGILLTLPFGNPKEGCTLADLPANQKTLEKALRKGRAYINIHSTGFPGGEIRGQIYQQRGGN